MQERRNTVNTTADIRRTVLVVDDHLSVGMILSAALAAHDFNVLTAGSGTEALKICRHYPGTIDVLLSAFGLRPKEPDPPHLIRHDHIEYGLTLVRRALEMRPSLKIVLFSGHSDESLVSSRIPEDWPIVRRPCDLKTLLKTLGEAVRVAA